MTRAQIKALKFAARWYGLRDGTIEQSLQIGLSGAALNAVISALETQGCVGGPYAVITDKGLAVLQRIKQREIDRLETFIGPPTEHTGGQ